MRRTLLTLLVVCLVVLAGCSLGGNSGTATPDPEDASTPTATSTPSPTESPTATATPTETEATETMTPTPTPTPAEANTPGDATPTAAPDLAPVSSMDAPPGVEGRDLANGSALLAAHRAELRGTAYRSETTIENSTGEDWRISHRNDTDATAVSVTNLSGDGGTDMYLDPAAAGYRNRTTGEVQYGHGPTTVRWSTRFGVQLFGLVGPAGGLGAEWQAIGVTTTDDGDQRMVFTAEHWNGSSSGLLLAGGDDATITAVDGRMEVTERGVIERVSFEATYERPDGSQYTVTVTHELVERGAVSVERPDWLSEPPQLEASTAEDGDLLVVEHTGGAAIDAGTNISVGGVFGLERNVTLDQRVASGDTMYVYQTGEGYDVEPHVAVTERPALPENATAFSGTVVIGGSQGPYTFEAGVEVDDEDEG